MKTDESAKEADESLDEKDINAVPVEKRCQKSDDCSSTDQGDFFCAGFASDGKNGNKNPHGECVPCTECHYDNDEINNECPQKCGGAQRKEL